MSLLIPLAAALVLAVAPGAAQAARVTYDVDVDLTFDYAHHVAYSGGGHDDDVFTVRVTGTIPQVRIQDGQFFPHNPVGGSSTPFNTGGSGQVASARGTWPSGPSS